MLDPVWPHSGRSPRGQGATPLHHLTTTTTTTMTALTEFNATQSNIRAAVVQALITANANALSNVLTTVTERVERSMTDAVLAELYPHETMDADERKTAIDYFAADLLGAALKSLSSSYVMRDIMKQAEI